MESVTGYRAALAADAVLLVAMCSGTATDCRSWISCKHVKELQVSMFATGLELQDIIHQVMIHVLELVHLTFCKVCCTGIA